MKCLFVDDDRNVLFAFTRQLEDEFDIAIAFNASEALMKIESDPTINMVISDFKMPGMNGLDFLKTVKMRIPSMVTIMLTGQPELSIAMKAVNEGHVFKFLTKPCSVVELTKAITEGIAHQQLIAAEHELLEKTLSGCVMSLIDIMSTIDPIGSEEARELRAYSRLLAQRMECSKPWEVELATVLYEIGSYILPSAVLIKMRTSQELNTNEKKLLARIPEASARLVSNIPRLEGVASIILETHRVSSGVKQCEKEEREQYSKGTAILQVIKAFGKKYSETKNKTEAIELLKKEHEYYDADVLKEFEKILSCDPPVQKRKKNTEILSLDSLQPGVIVRDDVETTDGVLLVSAGTALDEKLLGRIKSYAQMIGLKTPPVIQE